jgi:hypothetical protein
MPNHCEYKAREAFLLDKFEAWSKKYGRTYSSKKDECFWFLVFEDNYESMNTKKNDLPPKDLVMPDYRRYLGGLFKYIDENSPTGNFGHPRCTNLIFDAMYMPHIKLVA